jgi:hypothetical protein
MYDLKRSLCIGLCETARKACKERSIEVFAAQFSNFDVTVRFHFDPTWSAVVSVQEN